MAKNSAVNEPVVSFIIPVDGVWGQFAVGIGRRIGIVYWDGYSTEATLLHIALEVETEDQYRCNRFNDAKADQRSRFFGGTMRLEEYGDIYEVTNGNLYRFSVDKDLVTLRTNVGVSNGLTWNEEIGKFYYIDTVMSDVKQYDYDAETGDISYCL